MKNKNDPHDKTTGDRTYAETKAYIRNLGTGMIGISNGLRKLGIDLRHLFFKSVLDQLGGKLEMVISGGAALKQDIIDTFDAIGITVLNGYGITECSPLISCNRSKYQKKGSVGVPIIGESVIIKNPDENGYFKTGDYGKLDAVNLVKIRDEEFEKTHRRKFFASI